MDENGPLMVIEIVTLVSCLTMFYPLNMVMFDSYIDVNLHQRVCSKSLPSRIISGLKCAAKVETLSDAFSWRVRCMQATQGTLWDELAVDVCVETT